MKAEGLPAGLALQGELQAQQEAQAEQQEPLVEQAGQ